MNTDQQPQPYPPPLAKPDTALQVAIATLVLTVINLAVIIYFVASGAVLIIDT
jgi:hypothetical protein